MKNFNKKLIKKRKNKNILKKENYIKSNIIKKLNNNDKNIIKKIKKNILKEVDYNKIF